MMIQACATTQITHKTYPNLTIKNIENTCKPDENWRVQILPMPLLVLRFKDCAGEKDLLLIITPMDDFKKEIRELSARLTLLHYLNFINDAQSTEKTLIWNVQSVKRETQNTKIRKQDIFYYLLSSHPLKHEN